jgi:general secretion pathway protein D
MARPTIFRYLALVLATLALAGCAAQRAYRQANDFAAHDQVEEALLKYREAVVADPGNAVYRIALLRARDTATIRLFEQAERDLAQGKTAQAQLAYQRVLAFDPASERARAGLRQVDASRRWAEMLQAATEFFDKKDYEQARQKIERILAEDPKHEAALALLEQVNDKTQLPAAEAGLAAAFRTPISLEFRDAPLKQSKRPFTSC